MKNIKIFNSFPVRLSIYIILIAGGIFLATFLVYFHSANTQVRDEAISHASKGLANTVLGIEQILESVEVAIENNMWQIPHLINHPDSMYSITEQMLRNNPMIIGSAIAFEPHFFHRKGEYFSPYSYRKNGEIANLQLGNSNYEYHYFDWYQIPKLLGLDYWSEPYYDDGGGESIMTTFSKPLYDENGKFYAIFTADVSLEWLASLVEEIKPYPNSYNIMIGRGGTYLVHHEQERILNETIFSATIDMPDSTTAYIGREMIAGNIGMQTLQNDDTLSYVLYAPIERTGWSVGVICPHDDVFARLDKMKRNVLFIFVVGLTLLLVCCYKIIQKTSKPLIDFASSANEIAQGNFTSPLPDIKSKDEMKTLHDSFESMQHSLVNYIEELKLTTANKERIESELRIANEIQMGMIPKIFPPFPERKDVDLFATLIPAKEVGGDLYDFFIDNNNLYFTVGDVSGKGIPASLLMAVTRSLFRNIASHLHNPTEIMRALNDSISQNNDAGMFVTLFIGIIDLNTGVLRYCNGGHNAPILCSNGETQFMSVKTNLPLGVFEGFEYEGEEITIAPYTKLFIYTDGVNEAENMEKALFGDERLSTIIKSCAATQTPQSLISAIIADIKEFTKGAEQNDDITMLAIHYKTKMQD